MGIPQPPPHATTHQPSDLPAILPFPLRSPPIGDEQAHYYGFLIKGGHYLFTVHFELWRRNLLLLVSRFWLRNTVVACEIDGLLPVLAVHPVLVFPPRPHAQKLVIETNASLFLTRLNASVSGPSCF